MRRAPIPKEIGNLAIPLFGAISWWRQDNSSGDHEEYVTVAGNKAYKVVFRTSHLRKRKRLKADPPPEDLPEGWSLHHMVDPSNGASIPVMHGPHCTQGNGSSILWEGQILYILYLYASRWRPASNPRKRGSRKFLTEEIGLRLVQENVRLELRVCPLFSFKIGGRPSPSFFTPGRGHGLWYTGLIVR